MLSFKVGMAIALLAGCGTKNKPQPPPSAQPAPAVSRSANATVTSQQVAPAPPTAPPKLPQNEGLSCSTFPVDTSFGQRQLWDGYKIAIQAADEDKFDDATNGETAGGDPLCRVAILDSSGQRIYTDDFQNVTLDDATGLAIDGAPDIVLHHDYGGNHGAGAISVISLKPQPHDILDLDEESWGQKQFEKDAKYGVVLSSDEWQDQLQNAYDWPNARVPSAVRMYRFVSGDLQDVTPEYCPEIQSNPDTRKMRDQLSQEALQQLKNAEHLSEEDDTGSVVLSLIVQDIFCHQFQSAYDNISNLWPERDRPNLIKNLQRASRGWRCPECTKAVSQWH